MGAKEGAGRGGRRARLKDVCCQRLNQIKIFVLFTLFSWLLLMLLLFWCVYLFQERRGRGIRWCDKAAGGNLFSFFLLSLFLAVFPKSEETKAQVNKTFVVMLLLLMFD